MSQGTTSVVPIRAFLSGCHPERSECGRAATALTQSKDRYREADIWGPSASSGQVHLSLSRLLKQVGPDLLPGNHVGRILLVPSDALVQLRPLLIRERDRIQQFRLLGRREII